MHAYTRPFGSWSCSDLIFLALPDHQARWARVIGPPGLQPPTACPRPPWRGRPASQHQHHGPHHRLAYPNTLSIRWPAAQEHRVGRAPPQSPPTWCSSLLLSRQPSYEPPGIALRCRKEDSRTSGRLDVLGFAVLFEPVDINHQHL